MNSVAQSRPDPDADRVLGRLTFAPVGSAEQLAPPVARALAQHPGISCWLAEIDPQLADTAAFCSAYDIPAAASANCVVVTGKREGEQRWAAAVVLATTRADVNNVVRRRLDVRKISFADQQEAVARTGMEYGGITPIGLPAAWPVFVDPAVLAAGPVVIGAGRRGAKLLIQADDLLELPATEPLPGLGVAR